MSFRGGVGKGCSGVSFRGGVGKGCSGVSFRGGVKGVVG